MWLVIGACAHRDVEAYRIGLKAFITIIKACITYFKVTKCQDVTADLIPINKKLPINKNNGIKRKRQQNNSLLMTLCLELKFCACQF